VFQTRQGFEGRANSLIRASGELYDFVSRAVSDALGAARAATGALTQQQALQYVDAVYEAAFEMLQTLGDAESET